MQRTRTSATASALAAVAVCGACTTTPAQTHADRVDLPTQIPATAGPALPIEYVIDGDTLIVSDPAAAGGERTIRLIGVDTPETKDRRTAVQCFGPQASDYTRAVTGHQVRLESDAAAGDTDTYGRTLAYVWDTTTGRMINHDLLADGMAREYTYRHTNYRYRDQFQNTAATARSAGTGLWGQCPPS